MGAQGGVGVTAKTTTFRDLLLLALDGSVERGQMSRDQAVGILFQFDEWERLLDLLSERTREKWEAEDALSRVRALVYPLAAADWAKVVRHALDGNRPSA
jgi:hypothetical protein